jgi:long-chain acyl-CoA synthetase
MFGRELVRGLNFKKILFKDQAYDQPVIQEAIDHLADYLQSGFRSSSPFVLLATYNHIKSFISYFAILKAGKIPAILDPGVKSIELTEIIREIDPAALILINREETGFQYDEEVVFRQQDKGFLITSDLSDVCTLAFTNAEDGYSKGAMLTEQNLLSEINALIKTNRLSPRSVTCALLPFHHLFGLMQGILVPSRSGGISVIQEIEVLRIQELVMKMEYLRVTHIYTVPSLYYLFSKIPEIDKLVRYVEEFYSGGTQLPLFIFDNFYSKTKRLIREGYGLTESSPGVALNFDNDGPVPGSFGKAMPGCEIIIRNDQADCPPGTIGEICVRGDMVFKGYFNREEATSRVLRDGWLHTGDYGLQDGKGNIYFCGLKKDMINVAGNNVYPKKLERLIRMNRMVEDVRIFKEESVLQGHVVGATIRLRRDSPENQINLKKWCQENINQTAVPKIWHFDSNS